MVPCLLGIETSYSTCHNKQYTTVTSRSHRQTHLQSQQGGGNGALSTGDGYLIPLIFLAQNHTHNNIKDQH